MYIYMRQKTDLTRNEWFKVIYSRQMIVLLLGFEERLDGVLCVDKNLKCVVLCVRL